MSQFGSASDRLRNGHLDIRRRRLLLHCWHRGTQEIDLLRGSFAETCLGGGTFDGASWNSRRFLVSAAVKLQT